MKGLFFGIPSVSVSNTLVPVIEFMSQHHYELIYYNTKNFKTDERLSYRFISYPDYNNGYRPDCVNYKTAYFEFAEILVDTADQLILFLLEEVEREKPDFILHSHLALWGKIVAHRYNIPAISFFTTFILEEKIVFPLLKKLKHNKDINFHSVNDGKRLYSRVKVLYEKAGISKKPDLWDVYTNKEALNISFILEQFQPNKELLNNSYKFVGSPQAFPSNNEKKDIIYVSFGTILNTDLSAYKTCISVLAHFKLDCVIVLGEKINLTDIGHVPDNIKLEVFVNQKELLQKTSIFITHGGMASVNEAIHALTPMIVIPQILEQQITATKIEELGIGIHIPYNSLTFDELKSSLEFLIDNILIFNSNIISLLASLPKESALEKTVELVNEFLIEI